ncbi:manganese efflux pump MntP family protein [Peptostreptococcus equinus]|uniref:Putative manganese efflux pump MntP n=1 Tax=Peptostreptococcus equinus TaxID=3003601 RepID=A0ABY7JPX5_9FIRM|nr:manganese efflux pump MntP family protein [Peptostreptococcus sp. CBA3647]WAW15155.1 manganese efflux pump MntP family protein [Peptostreptococcus sp. CBA3647]
MRLFDIVLIGTGLSMDAFAVAICKGMCQREMNWKKAGIIALFFGFFQAFMPFIGYFLGSKFANFIASIDHWVAFILLALIGFNMIRESREVKTEEEILCDASGDLKIDYKELLTLSIATSIDALAIGFSFALLKINILFACSIIGLITLTLSTLAVYVGFRFGTKYKSKSEIIGGTILILIGLKILLEGIRVL